MLLYGSYTCVHAVKGQLKIAGYEVEMCFAVKLVIIVLLCVLGRREGEYTFVTYICKVSDLHGYIQSVSWCYLEGT